MHRGALRCAVGFCYRNTSQSCAGPRDMTTGGGDFREGQGGREQDGQGDEETCCHFAPALTSTGISVGFSVAPVSTLMMMLLTASGSDVT